MRRFFLLIGLLLCAFGGYLVLSTYLFVHRAITVEAEVVAVEERRGPPKPRSKVPLHVKYRLPDGTEHLSKTSMPLLQKVESGDRLQLLVDGARPEVVRLPLLSVLWATPLTVVLVGILLAMGSRFLPTASRRLD
jgi:hypothetical protein